jgi:hypothetical protein
MEIAPAKVRYPGEMHRCDMCDRITLTGDMSVVIGPHPYNIRYWKRLCGRCLTRVQQEGESLLMLAPQN